MIRNIDQVEHDHNVLWLFDTARYTIAFWAEPEDMSPIGNFSDPLDVAFAMQGWCGNEPAHWFCAFVAIFDGDYIAHNCLGGCAYNSFDDFVHSHHRQYRRNSARPGTWLRSRRDKGWKLHQGSGGDYFTSMVKECVRQARNGIALASDGARRA